ncbi:hypothetical protein PG999_014110 [Apiospora kogelbergensis]|uniref:Quinate transporter n=1 Tax=Apiospora kogelbergensis TaxID=1337665 RepID=A0AAW0Q851_9PEZI
MGALMFGYDLGFIGTAIELSSFQRDFGLEHASKSEKAAFSANVVSLLQAGCIVGSLAAGPFASHYGRRSSLFLTAAFFLFGSALQTGAGGARAMMFAGRAIGGVGVGAASMVVPLYIAEASPPRIRGRLVGTYEVFVSMGTMLGFWINYGLERNIPSTSAQWIISFAVQLIPGCLLMAGLFLIPESPRWLAEKKGRDACLDEEAMLTEGDGPRALFYEMLKPANLKRLYIGCVMFVLMQMAGSNAINYYSPSIFKSIGLVGSDTSFFATGIYGLVRFVAIIAAMNFFIDRFGRRKNLMCGSSIMACAMWYIGAYVKIEAPGAPGTSSHISSAGYLGIAMIYVYAIGWCFSWAGIPWVYASEIFPLRIRSICVSICVAVHWILNFVIARSVPYMINNIGFGTYFVFASFITIAIPWVFFCVPETKGRSMEDMDIIFGLPNGVTASELQATEEKGSSAHLEDQKDTHTI